MEAKGAYVEGLVVASNEVDSILFVAILVVVEVVPHSTLPAVVQEAHGRPHARAGEPTLEGTCARVLCADGIPMVRPQDPERPVQLHTRTAIVTRDQTQDSMPNRRAIDLVEPQSQKAQTVDSFLNN